MYSNDSYKCDETGTITELKLGDPFSPSEQDLEDLVKFLVFMFGVDEAIRLLVRQLPFLKTEADAEVLIKKLFPDLYRLWKAAKLRKGADVVGPTI